MTTQDTAQEQDVVDILTADHQDMLDLIGQIQQATTAEQRRDTVDTVIAEIMRHAVAEEMHVYPAMEEYLPNGSEEVEHDKQEHEELVDVMKKLEDVDADTQQFMSLVSELEAQLRHHVEDEEQEQFPGLRKHIPADELKELGRKVEKAKSIAPTRPHPNAPHSELFHKTVGPGVGLVDRLRDKLTARHTEKD
jgi:hemerythrin-like domain-containing protein